MRGPSADSSSAASAPEPAPNSQTSSLPEAASASSTWRDSARPNSGDSSGAVTKSLPPSGIRPTTIRPLA